MSRPARLPRALALAAVVLLGADAACVQRADRSPVAAPTTTTTAEPTSSTAAPTTTATAAPAPYDMTTARPPTDLSADPAAVAARIVATERVLRDPAASEQAVSEAALTQQLAYRQLGDRPDWDAPVQAAVPPDLQAAVGRQVAARREFGAILRRPPTALPAWRIVPPAPFDQLRADYDAAAAAFGLPWQFLAAINLVETATGRIRGTSTAGAQGPMQFLPATWAAYGGGGNIEDVHDAIFGAARYLAANGGATDMPNALWHYNHNDHYVRGVTLYAELLAEHPLAWRAFYHWGVWYRMVAGDTFLPVGYGE
jgi:membrane-bound lytic murein transglycosylase B